MENQGYKKIVRNKFRKLAIGIIALIVMLGAVTVVTRCDNTFTDEEHVQRITERVQRKFIDNAEHSFTDFTVTMLYDGEDNPIYFMVEFKPQGFLYGVIFENRYYYLDRLSFFEEGRSHFYEAGITDERKHLYLNKGIVSVAVRRGDVFVRLPRGTETTSFPIGPPSRLMINLYFNRI